MYGNCTDWNLFPFFLFLGKELDQKRRRKTSSPEASSDSLSDSEDQEEKSKNSIRDGKKTKEPDEPKPTPKRDALEEKKFVSTEVRKSYAVKIVCKVPISAVPIGLVLNCAILNSSLYFQPGTSSQ